VSEQELAVRKLELQLQFEKKRLEDLKHNAQELNGCAPRTPETHPFVRIKNCFTAEDREEVRAFFAEKRNTCQAAHIVNGSDYHTAVINQRIFLPRFEAKLKQLFPGMIVYRTVYLAGEVDGGRYSGWHTDYNGTKAFKTKVKHPRAYNLWVPLQPLNEETGGRLWFYDGPHMKNIENVLRLCHKKSMILQYMLLGLLKDELDAHQATENMEFGDALLFSEIRPHKVDTSCKVQREVFTCWLIDEDAVLDDEFIDEVIAFPEDETVNELETKVHMKALERFITDARNLWNTTQAHNKGNVPTNV